MQPEQQTMLPAPAIAEVRRLYAIRDARGRRVYSQAAIAKIMGCGETTVYRIVNEIGGYQRATPEILLDEAKLQTAAAASYAKLQELLAAEQTTGPAASMAPTAQKGSSKNDDASRPPKPAEPGNYAWDDIGQRWLKLPY